MKYIIEDKQLFELIYKFIDNDLKDDDIRFQYGYNYDKGGTDVNVLSFFGDKYANVEQDDWYFEYIKKEYYENLPDNDSVKIKWLDKAPLVEVMDYDFQNKLNGLFGPYWKVVFEQWFRDNYPDLHVKSFNYYLDNK